MLRPIYFWQIEMNQSFSFSENYSNSAFCDSRNAITVQCDSRLHVKCQIAKIRQIVLISGQMSRWNIKIVPNSERKVLSFTVRLTRQKDQGDLINGVKIQARNILLILQLISINSINQSMRINILIPSICISLTHRTTSHFFNTSGIIIPEIAL